MLLTHTFSLPVVSSYALLVLLLVLLFLLSFSEVHINDTIFVRAKANKEKQVKG